LLSPRFHYEDQQYKTTYLFALCLAPNPLHSAVAKPRADFFSAAVTTPEQQAASVLLVTGKLIQIKCLVLRLAFDPLHNKNKTPIFGRSLSVLGVKLKRG